MAPCIHIALMCR